MQGLRRQGRSYALQLLYQIDVARNADAALRERFWHTSKASRRARAFGSELVDTTVAHQAAIDARLDAALERWRLARLPVVVRNALRLATCEMTVIREEPAAVIINEALELIRVFMDEDSARFANSVLDKVRLNAEAEGAGPAGAAPAADEAPEADSQPYAGAEDDVDEPPAPGDGGDAEAQ